MQETPETRAKLANAINQLRSQGREAEVNSLVGAYKTKYTSQVVANKPTFDVPNLETQEQKIARYNSESADLAQKSKEANSFLGMTKNFGKAFVENIAGSETGLGRTIAKLDSKPREMYSQSIQQTDEIQANLLKQIRKNEAEGKDSTKLKQLYNEGDKTRKGMSAGLGEATTLPTQGQAVGQLAGTALDLLTAGTYGRAKAGMQSFKLAPKTTVMQKATALVPELSNIAKQKASGLFSRRGIANVAKGAGIGYGYDVSTGLQNKEENPYEAGIGTLIGGGIPVLSETFQTGKNVLPLLTKEGRVNRVIKSRDKVLTNIEESYASVKKTVDKQKARGIDVKKIVADKDILVNAVDENGNINTKQAVENIMPAIEEREGVIGKILEQEGRTININKLKNEMVKGIKNTRSIFGKNTALASIEDDLADLANLADANGNIKVSDIHSAKVDKYSKINYDNPAVATFEKAKAKVFKQIVENETKGIDVGAVNKELQTLYAVQNYLEKLQGKKVEGGRLGKHFARVTGAIVGGHFGPIGALLGSELSAGIKGVTMKAGLSGRTGNVPYKAGAEMQNALDRVNNPKVLQLPAYSNIDGNLNANQIKTTIPNNIDISKTIPQKLTNLQQQNLKVAQQLDNEKLINFGGKDGTAVRTLQEIEDLDKSLNFPAKLKSIPKKNTQAGFISTGKSDDVVKFLESKGGSSLENYNKLSKPRKEIYNKFYNETGEDIKKATINFQSDEVRRELGGKTFHNYTPEQVDMINSFKETGKTSPYLFHTSKIDNLDSIKKNGLTTGNKSRYEGVSAKDKIYLASNEATSKYYGSDNDFLVRVKKSYQIKNLEEDIIAGGGSYMTGKNIPPEALEVKIGNKWIELKEANNLLQDRGALPKKTNQAGLISTGGKDLQPLYKEAQGKSMEEFVKAQGTPVYHGTTAKFDDFDLDKAGSATDSGMFGRGIYFTESRGEAYGYSKGTGNIKEVYLDMKKPFVINSGKDIPKIDVPFETISDMKNSDKNYSKLFTKYLQDRGYDGVIDNMSGLKQHIVFDTKSIKTKSQLEQIWKEANSKTSTKQGMTAINPLTVGAGVSALGAGYVALKNKDKK